MVLISWCRQPGLEMSQEEGALSIAVLRVIEFCACGGN